MTLSNTISVLDSLTSQPPHTALGDDDDDGDDCDDLDDDERKLYKLMIKVYISICVFVNLYFFICICIFGLEI